MSITYLLAPYSLPMFVMEVRKKMRKGIFLLSAWEKSENSQETLIRVVVMSPYVAPCTGREI